jgi:hypothetical protein
VIFFYELLFIVVTVVAVVIGEVWSRLAAVVFLLVWFGAIWLGYASFDVRLAAADGLEAEERRWFTDARDGLRHLRLLFGLAAVAAVAWRLIAG